MNMMKRLFILITLFQWGLVSGAQTRVRDLFTSAPDSIFPLLTMNNRLDMLDFRENNMTARVKNRMDDACELKELADDYLLLQVSAHSTAELRLLGDSLLCLINTYLGPTADSRVRFFDTAWKPAGIALPRPGIEDFWQPVPDSLAQEARFARQSLQALPLLKVSAQAGEPILTFALQTAELAEKEKEVAQRYVHSLRFRWDGKAFLREP